MPLLLRFCKNSRFGQQTCPQIPCQGITVSSAFRSSVLSGCLFGFKTALSWVLSSYSSSFPDFLLFSGFLRAFPPAASVLCVSVFLYCSIFISQYFHGQSTAGGLFCRVFRLSSLSLFLWQGLLLCLSAICGKPCRNGSPPAFLLRQ